MHSASTILIIVITLMFVPSFQISLDKDLTISLEQKEILDKFRNLVSARLVHDYMRKDIYLIRWLRARNFNIPAAEKMLMENLKWRKENKMDQILNEDWAYFEESLPFEIQGCDKGGRAVVSIPVGEWDVRRAIISGHLDRTTRYYNKMLEETAVLIRRAQSDGENMTQFSLIMDMANFNLIIHACPLCTTVYTNLFLSMESNYPGSVHSAILINVPQVFLAVWEILREFLSEQSRSQVFIYGKDKIEWKRALLEEIDATDLTKEYGGNNDEGFSMEDLKDEITRGPMHCSRLQSIRESRGKIRKMGNI